MSRKAARSRRVSKSRKSSRSKLSTPAPVSDVKQVVEPLELNTFRERLMEPQDVSQYLRIPIGTLSNWRNSNPPIGPKCLKVGHHVRYRLSDVEQWLAEGTRTTFADSERQKAMEATR